MKTLAAIGCQLSALLAAIGCASMQGPEQTYLRIDPAAYHEAFDAAVEAARRAGMPPTFRDRRRGLIDTAPSIAGSIFEPWRDDNATFSQSLESTIAFQRRRARFEFTPAESTEPAEGWDPFGTRDDPINLASHDGPLLLRVWVWLERAHEPGFHRGTWTRSQITRTTVGGEGAGPTPPLFWTPLARDPLFEQRLLKTVADRLAH